MFASVLKNHFSPDFRRRGERYFKENRVSFVSRNKNTVRFIVLGSKGYECLFERGEITKNPKHGLVKPLNMYCECPYFDDYAYCKHLWASLRKGDSLGIWDDFFRLKDGGPGEQTASRTDANSVEQKFLEKKIGELSVRNAFYKENRKKTGQLKLYYGLNRRHHRRESSGLVVNFYSLSPTYPNCIEKKQIRKNDFEKLSDPLDRELILLLTSSLGMNYWSHVYDYGIIQYLFQHQILNKLCQTGRLFSESNYRSYDIDSLNFLKFNENTATIKTQLGLKNSNILIKSHLECGDERIPLEDLLVLWDGGTFVSSKTVGRFEPGQFDWIMTLRELGRESISKSDKDFLIQGLFKQEMTPDIEFSEDMGWQLKKEEKPKPKIVIEEKNQSETRKEFYGEVLFMYGHSETSSLSSRKYSVDEENKVLHLRDIERESELLAEAESMDLNPAPVRLSQSYNFRIRKNQFVSMIKELIDRNWYVEALGKKVESAMNMNFSVTSGVDWFDLESDITFESGERLTLPELIKSLKQGENLIPLGNGQYGMLPEEWFKKYSGLTKIGDDKGNKEGLRFSKAQGIFLDGWFAEERNFIADRGFSDFQKTISKTSLKKKMKPAKTFKGKLRDYQEEGLSWLEYLNKLSFGGILADDMGLGKTIQVIALLQKKREKKVSSEKPHLIVVPKSLVFNWKDEFEKFAPEISVLTYVNKERKEFLNNMGQYDVIITTYQTLRIDFEELNKIEFGYIILDEAQYIKNPKSQASQACKMMDSEYRLALTGTPVENSVNDLFSILDFVNPGLISGKLRDSFSGSTQDSDDLRKLSKALLPMILRRTKDQVLKDLPDKVESTIKCELSKSEQKHYDSLKKYYQMKLSKKIKERGFNQSKIEILEALLRLRQAACHPGLIDRRRTSEKSSKLDVLFEQIHSLVSSGNKCLVFSQFTSFLSVIRPKLEKERIDYLYLDGKTGKRKELVKKFEQDDEFKVFLISLKAGGVGLNLISANYVFILDPWWNPAVESQAVDRTHRIGQKNNVFAYKLISKDTVEEKILELQKTKKSLSDALINSNSGMLKKMNMNDLNFLLS